MCSRSHCGSQLFPSGVAFVCNHCMSADSAATRSRQTKPKLHQIWFQKSKTASCLALFGNTISDFSNPVASAAHELVYFQLLPCRGTDRIRRLPPGTLLLRGCQSLWLGRCQQWIISACFGHDSAWPHKHTLLWRVSRPPHRRRTWLRSQSLWRWLRHLCINFHIATCNANPQWNSGWSCVDFSMNLQNFRIYSSRFRTSESRISNLEKTWTLTLNQLQTSELTMTQSLWLIVCGVWQCVVCVQCVVCPIAKTLASKTAIKDPITLTEIVFPAIRLRSRSLAIPFLWDSIQGFKLSVAWLDSHWKKHRVSHHTEPWSWNWRHVHRLWLSSFRVNLHTSADQETFWKTLTTKQLTSQHNSWPESRVQI